MFPLLSDEGKEFGIGEVGVVLLELLADLVLEKNVGRGGAFGGIGVLGFGVALALLGAVAVLGREGSLALALDMVV